MARKLALGGSEALAVARKLALGGSEALAVARKLALGGSEALGGTGCGSEAALAVALALWALALGGGCSGAEPRAIWLHGRLDDSTVE